MVEVVQLLRRGLGIAGFVFCIGCAQHTPPPVAGENPQVVVSRQKAMAWEAFGVLAGTWQVAIDGKLGLAPGVRQYKFILKDRYLLVRQESAHPSQPKYPGGDEHSDLGIYSYDKARDSIVYRQFFSEGVIVQFTCDFEGKRFLCVSERTESSCGMQVEARFSFEIVDSERLKEVYEIGFDGRDLEVYFVIDLIRIGTPRD